MNEKEAIEQLETMKPFDYVKNINPITKVKSPLYTKAQVLLLIDCIFGCKERVKIKPMTNPLDKSKDKE